MRDGALKRGQAALVDVWPLEYGFESRSIVRSNPPVGLGDVAHLKGVADVPHALMAGGGQDVVIAVRFAGLSMCGMSVLNPNPVDTRPSDNKFLRGAGKSREGIRVTLRECIGHTPN